MTEKLPSNAEMSGQLYDELLVTLAQVGNRKAADRLVRRWHPRLMRTARRYTNETELAEHVAQECWLAIWRGLPSLRDPSKFAPWAFTILRKKSADVIRASVRQSDKAGALEETQTHSQAASQEYKVAISQAFAVLPADQRLAAHLYFIEGMTLREIAAVQGIAEGTAKTRLFHARRKLKAALEPETNETTQGEIL